MNFLNKYLPRVDFKSYEDFKANYRKIGRASLGKECY